MWAFGLKIVFVAGQFCTTNAYKQVQPLPKAMLQVTEKHTVKPGKKMQKIHATSCNCKYKLGTSCLVCCLGDFPETRHWVPINIILSISTPKERRQVWASKMSLDGFQLPEIQLFRLLRTHRWTAGRMFHGPLCCLGTEQKLKSQLAWHPKK